MPVLAAIVVALGLPLPAVAGAQQQSAAVGGTVVDAVSNRVAGAAVLLLDSLGFEVARTATDAIGRFVFEDVPPGTYALLADVGLKSGAVIEVQSSASQRSGLRGSVDVGIGSEGAASTRAVAGGPLNGRLTIGGSFAAERSDRFLDPVHPDNLHNAGSALSGNVNVSLAPSDDDLVKFDLGAGGSQYQVPHGAAQEEAGQDAGLLASVTRQVRRHTMKVGMEADHQSGIRVQLREPIQRHTLRRASYAARGTADGRPLAPRRT